MALAFLCWPPAARVAALAQGFGLLALGRLACGAGFVISTIYLTKMTADWFSGKELATAMGLLVMSWPLGIALGQVSQVWIDDALRLAQRLSGGRAVLCARRGWRCCCCTGRRRCRQRRRSGGRACRATSCC